ncbi:FmdB family zinc ribbon protein [Microbacterium sp.]|uniref:FmdB family zinc ribbon protein n=1 Tax=Microbacterium sp. TaxID=51671 RepID=UPI001ACAAEF0|nr:FmdB family zinc ribbon protein [Microbacterium sp.]MBN9157476.1 FmdB family transcriptional regulator [Microbacterium sp.]MBS1899320.1 FmdB family transcriptional regulator [Actinomycetota bacterium]
MPTYSYACTACGHRFDAVQSFSDSALTECPECQGRLRKEYGSIGVTFNGSGFYRTDSRAGSGSSSSAGASSKAESTASTKPAPASAPASGS